MDTAILSALITAVGTLAGTFIGIWSQRENKRLQALQRRIERYRQEIRARQAEEDIACTWLVEAGLAASQRAAMLALRERTEIGHRPRFSGSSPGPPSLQPTPLPLGEGRGEGGPTPRYKE